MAAQAEAAARLTSAVPAGSSPASISAGQPGPWGACPPLSEDTVLLLLSIPPPPPLPDSTAPHRPAHLAEGTCREQTQHPGHIFSGPGPQRYPRRSHLSPRGRGGPTSPSEKWK